jgi:hypothetical protein
MIFLIELLEKYGMQTAGPGMVVRNGQTGLFRNKQFCETKYFCKFSRV